MNALCPVYTSWREREKKEEDNLPIFNVDKDV